MDTKAGELFICVCCSEEHDASQASLDRDLRGPVCDECRRSLRGGLAWLKKCIGCDIRPLIPADVNDDNYKRFQT